MTTALKRLGAVLSACAAIAAASASVHAAQSWQPQRPVSLVVPYAPGGGTDTTARAVAEELARLWGQPVMVENLPGADGLIGTRKVMDARPDGHTLLFQVPSLLLNKHLPGLKGGDPLERLVPVTAVAESPPAIIASAKLPVNSLDELVQHCRAAKARPCSLATGEISGKLWAQQFADDLDLPELVIVNYKGTSAMVPDIIAHNVDMAFTGITAALPHHEAGRLKILATRGEQRAAALPDVPTTAEAGYPWLRSMTWFGLFAPKGTAPEVTEGIADAVREAVRSAGVQRIIAGAGASPVANPPAEFAARVREDSEQLDAMVARYPLE